MVLEVAMRRIVIANQKGGVGKSTVAINLAWALSRLGQRVLVVDGDPQCNATVGFLGFEEPHPTLYQVFTEDATARAAIVQVADRLELLPCSIALAGADIEFAQQMGRESKLKRALSRVRYDFVLFDTPPSLGLLSLNALMSGQEVLVPVSASFWALRGIEFLEDTIEQIRGRMNHRQLRVLGSVATMVDKVTNVSRDALEIIREHFGEKMFATTIPKTVRLEEANARSQSIFAYAPKSPAAEAFNQLAKEVISHE